MTGCYRKDFLCITVIAPYDITRRDLYFGILGDEFCRKITIPDLVKIKNFPDDTQNRFFFFFFFFLWVYPDE